jgi:peptide deformylase
MTESKIQPIVGYGSPILREVCKEVENNAESQNLIESLISTSESIKTAVGLAAPQININARMFIMCPDDTHIVVINPIIKKRRGSVKSHEGCLSIPGVNETVPNRDEIIDVEYFDENFNKKKIRLRGFDAIIFQHEFDHLNGVLYTDLLTTEGKEAVKDKLSDIEKGIYKPTQYEMVFTKV